VAIRFGVIDEEQRDVDPGPFFHVWEWFVALHRRRQYDGAAGVHQPISEESIFAFSKLRRVQLAAHEIRLIEQIDDYFIDQERSKRARSNKQQEDKIKRKR